MQKELDIQNDQKTELNFDLQSDRLRSLGELSASILHEINQPLTSIKMSSELALRMLEKGSSENIQNIYNNIKEILLLTTKVEEIICRLQNFSRNKKNDNFTFVNLNDTIRNAISILNHRFSNENIKISKSLQKIPLVKGHSVWLDQVFINLLTNASDALIHKGTQTGTNKSLYPEIKIISKFNKSEQYVEIKVSDNAGAILDENRKKIFHPFFTTKEDKGTGLGLSISNMIIQALNGEILLDSVEGLYSTFYIKLPVA